MLDQADQICQTALLVWAGVSLGGNLIAAPAKFRVKTLEMPMALRVGRAQFGWIGRGELVLAFVAFASSTLIGVEVFGWVSVICAIFAFQRLVLMPRMAHQSDKIIAGTATHQSRLHIWFVVFEIIKFIGLLTSGVWISS